MEITEQEKEIIAFFLGKHWQEFAANAEEVLSQCALHRLAEKLNLQSTTPG